MIQKNGVHGLTHGVVAPEGERHIAQAAADQSAGQHSLDLTCRFDKGARVVIVFFNAGRNRKNIGIEDNVLGRESDRLGKNVIRTLCYLYLPLQRIRLTFFIKSHDHNCRTVAPDSPRLLNERLLAFFQADGIDNALALQAF